MCLTYIIEKGEDSQAVGFVSGFNKALVLVRIVMDDVELKDKQTQCRRKEERELRQASKQSRGGGWGASAARKCVDVDRLCEMDVPFCGTNGGAFQTKSTARRSGCSQPGP